MSKPLELHIYKLSDDGPPITPVPGHLLYYPDSLINPRDADAISRGKRLGDSDLAAEYWAAWVEWQQEFNWSKEIIKTVQRFAAHPPAFE